MKLILTGATGFIGSEVLSHCLSSPSIDSIVVLSRRPLPGTASSQNPKVQVVLLEDFTSYPPSVLHELEGAQAFVWCLGQSFATDAEATRKVSIDYTVAGLEVVRAAVVPGLRARGGEKEKMRFVYLGGKFNERDQERSLWFLGNLRKARGVMETKLLELPDDDTLEAYIVKPSAVLKKDAWLLGMVMGVTPFPTIKVDELAAAILDLVTVGDEKRVWDNAELAQKGRHVLRRGS